MQSRRGGPQVADLTKVSPVWRLTTEIRVLEAVEGAEGYPIAFNVRRCTRNSAEPQLLTAEEGKPLGIVALLAVA